MKKNIFIIILLVIILCLGGVIIYDKTTKKEVEKPKEEVKEEVLDVTSKEVTTLFNNLNTLAQNNHGDTYYYGYLYKEDSLKVEDIDDSIIVATGVYKEHLKCLQSWSDTCIKTASNNSAGEVVIPAENVKKVINEIFGKINYENIDTKSLSCGGEYKYNSNDNYVAQAPACGYAGESFDFLETRIAKALKKGNDLDIYVKVAFGHYDFSESEEGNKSIYHIYSDYNKTNEIYKAKEEIYNFDDILSNYSDKFSIYKMHFEKENNEYHFKNIEKQ